MFCSFYDLLCILHSYICVFLINVSDCFWVGATGHRQVLGAQDFVKAIIPEFQSEGIEVMQANTNERFAILCGATYARFLMCFEFLVFFGDLHPKMSQIVL